LSDPTSLRHGVFHQYVHLLRIRTSQPAFHPSGAQRVLFGNDALFALLRTSPNGQEHVLCIHNVSDRKQRFQADLDALGLSYSRALRDLVYPTHHSVGKNGRLELTAEPYQVMWLKA
jgi:hypothetical protein